MYVTQLGEFSFQILGVKGLNKKTTASCLDNLKEAKGGSRKFMPRERGPKTNFDESVTSLHTYNT